MALLPLTALFEGDILLQYAMLGLVALWMVFWNPKLLLALGVASGFVALFFPPELAPERLRPEAEGQLPPEHPRADERNRSEHDAHQRGLEENEHCKDL